MKNVETRNFELLRNVDVELTVQLGHKKMKINEILGLGEGSIVELEEMDGEPVTVLVNGKPIAKAEVVVIDQYFGVRIKEILRDASFLENYA
jgi:flagellar motor switch protein FliN